VSNSCRTGAFKKGVGGTSWGISGLRRRGRGITGFGGGKLGNINKGVNGDNEKVNTSETLPHGKP